MPEAVSLFRVCLSEAAVSAAVAVLRSGRLSGGECVEAFEDAFAQAVGSREAVAVSSGTMALLLTYMALFQPGDEVLVPAFTHMSTAAAVRLAGAVPVLCDIDRDTWTIDPDDAAARLTTRTCGIVGVHLFGNSCAVGRLQHLARRHGLALVWDASHAHLTRYRGQDVGAYGDAACYSFYPTKAMTTGEGGMVTTGAPDLAARLRRLRNHGETAKYAHTSLGLNGRMTDISAAIGLVELAELPGRTDGRRRNARRLDAAVAAVPSLVRQQLQPGVRHTYHQYAVRVVEQELGRSREEVALWLRQRGVETAVHYPLPLHRQPLWAQERNPGPLPAAEELARQVLCLPVRHDLTPGELAQVRDSLRSLAPGPGV